MAEHLWVPQQPLTSKCKVDVPPAAGKREAQPEEMPKARHRKVGPQDMAHAIGGTGYDGENPLNGEVWSPDGMPAVAQLEEQPIVELTPEKVSHLGVAAVAHPCKQDIQAGSEEGAQARANADAHRRHGAEFPLCRRRKAPCQGPTGVEVHKELSRKLRGGAEEQAGKGFQ